MGSSCNRTDGRCGIRLWYLCIDDPCRSRNVFPFVWSGCNLLICRSDVLPTSKNNKNYIEKRLTESISQMEEYIRVYPDFPVPAHYAHPIVLKRMQEIMKEGRARNIPEALQVLKKDLKALNSSVVVEKEEYDEVVAIKPMFLVMDYK